MTRPSSRLIQQRKAGKCSVEARNLKRIEEKIRELNQIKALRLNETKLEVNDNALRLNEIKRIKDMLKSKLRFFISIQWPLFLEFKFPNLSDKEGFGAFIIIPQVMDEISADLRLTVADSIAHRNQKRMQLQWNTIHQSYHRSRYYNMKKKNKADSKRYAITYRECPECARSLVDALDELCNRRGYHKSSGFACIHSTKGCVRQNHHVDYADLVGT